MIKTLRTFQATPVPFSSPRSFTWFLRFGGSPAAPPGGLGEPFADPLWAISCGRPQAVLTPASALPLTAVARTETARLKLASLREPKRPDACIRGLWDPHKRTEATALQGGALTGRS